MARLGRRDRGLLAKIRDGRQVWYVRLYHHGQERRFGSFATKTAARDFYEKAKLEQKEGRFFPERFQHGGYELVQICIDRYEQLCANKKSRKDQRYFAQWWRSRFEGKRLNTISAVVLEDIRQRLLCTGLTPQRVNRYFAWLRACLNVAVREGRLMNNPVKSLKMFKEPKGRTRFLSSEEEDRLLAALGAPYDAWTRFAILTGLRQEEQFSLKWVEVDLERNLITLPATKAGDIQYVPVTQEAKDILRGFDSWQRSVWVFPSLNSSTHVDARNFYRRIFLPAVRRIGLENVTWHALRHTFAGRLAMAGHGDGTIAALLRHSGTALVKRYAHLSDTHLRQAMEGVSQFGRPDRQAVVSDHKTGSIADPTVTETGTAEVMRGKKSS